MEKRKIYIITTLLILALLTALAVWYAYVVRQESLIGTTQDIPTQGFSVPVPYVPSTQSSSNNNDATTFGSKYNEATTSSSTSTASSTQDIFVEPETWSLSLIHADPVSFLSNSVDSIKFVDSKTNSITKVTQRSLNKTTLSKDSLAGAGTLYILRDDYVLVVPGLDDYPYITQYSPSGELATTTKELPDQISQVALTDTAFYYLTPNQNKGVSIKTVPYIDLLKDTVHPTTFWESTLSGWVLQSTDSRAYVTQKASNSIPGYSYLLSSQKQEPIAQDLPGLEVLVSPNTKKALYSTVDQKGISLYLKDIRSGDVTILYTKTLASKCAWGSGSLLLYCAVPATIPNNLPDTWYRGQVHFTDSLWRIDTKSGEANELVSDTGLDIINLHIASDTLMFKNKTDQSLWAITKDNL